MHEFALIWQALPKVVFSRTLDSVEGANTTLARDDLRESDLAPGVRAWRRGGRGRRVAAEAARLDLIDEYRLFVHLVAVGGGIPFFREITVFPSGSPFARQEHSKRPASECCIARWATSNWSARPVLRAGEGMAQEHH